MKSYLDKKSGFTLIELLVVISIIAILTAVLLPNMVGVRQRGSDARTKNDLKQLKTALRLYYNDYQTYPSHHTSYTLNGCGPNGTSNCPAAPGAFSAGNGTAVTYMKELPLKYKYLSADAGESFKLCTELQNVGDKDIKSSQESCSVAAASVIITTNPALDINKAFCVCTD